MNVQKPTIEPAVTSGSYWINIAIAEITKRFPKGEIIVSSGISPSASYHIGHFREILTVDILVWGLKKTGREAKHLHIVDNFDPLRKRYDFLPEEFEQYVGQPVCLIPDPVGACHKTYADHFYSEFKLNIKVMGINPTIIKSYEDLYKTGKMAERFEEVLLNIKEVHRIFKEVSNRNLESEWTPIQVLDDDGRYFNAVLSDWNKPEQTIAGKSYTDGHAKLNWRLDWPARWKTLGVMVEPHGRELASSGSAYHTGREFARTVFNIKPPLPVAQYEPIYLAGDTRKMSSSLGNLVTPAQAFAIMPPAVLRYFILKSRPERPVYFDPGLGYIRFINEFKNLEQAVVGGQKSEFAQAYEASLGESNGPILSAIPFDHLVMAYQAALGKTDLVLDSLARSGHGMVIKKQKSLVIKELDYVKNWLQTYAPPEVKFEVQQILPKVNLTEVQKQFLNKVATYLESSDQISGDDMHTAIHEIKNQLGIVPKEAFSAIYQVILSQDSGPKAGWFLAVLDREWLVKRLRTRSLKSV
jgi:lysyl-tRNA synthetase class 1